MNLGARQILFHEEVVARDIGEDEAAVRSEDINAFGVQQEIQQVHISDSAFVACSRLQGVVRDHELGKVVFDAEQGGCFLDALLFVGDEIGGLDVNLARRVVYDKVDFIASRFMSAVGVTLPFHDADVNGITAPDQFAVDDILHQMRGLELSKIHARVSKARVCCVVFCRIVQIVPTLDVVSVDLLDDKGVFKVLEVVRNRRLVDGCLERRREDVCKFVWIGERTDGAHHDIDDSLKQHRVFDFIPFNDIADVDGIIEVGKILSLLGIGILEDAVGHASEAHVFFKKGVWIGIVGFAPAEFSERERMHIDDLSASAKLGCDVARQHLGVGSCHIHIYVGRCAQPVQDVDKRNVAGFPVVRVNLIQIHAVGQDFMAPLNFVYQDIAHPACRCNALANILVECKRIRERLVGRFFKVNFNDVVWRNPRVKKMILKNIEKGETLADTSNAGQYLYEIIPLRFDKRSFKLISDDCHSHRSVLIFMDLSVKFNMPVLYHNRPCRARRRARVARSRRHERDPSLEAGRMDELKTTTIRALI